MSRISDLWNLPDLLLEYRRREALAGRWLEDHNLSILLNVKRRVQRRHAEHVPWSTTSSGAT